MYIDVNNIKIHYQVLGKGKPIILLSGNGKYTGYMKILGNKLSKKYMVYLFDRRCSGKSTYNCQLTYEDTVDDLYQFIQKLNIHKPIILGHSGGRNCCFKICY